MRGKDNRVGPQVVCPLTNVICNTVLCSTKAPIAIPGGIWALGWFDDIDIITLAGIVGNLDPQILGSTRLFGLSSAIDSWGTP